MDNTESGKTEFSFLHHISKSVEVSGTFYKLISVSAKLPHNPEVNTQTR